MAEDCFPKEMKDYVAKHLEDDAEHHLSMTTEEYRKTHDIMWNIIDWDTWVDLMQTQADYSSKAANRIRDLPECKPKPSYAPAGVTIPGFNRDTKEDTQTFDSVYRFFEEWAATLVDDGYNFEDIYNTITTTHAHVPSNIADIINKALRE
jgi:hypothetical protein